MPSKVTISEETKSRARYHEQLEEPQEEFKVGDEVFGKYRKVEYTGVITMISSDIITVDRKDGTRDWKCKKRNNGTWACANLFDDEKYNLKLIKDLKQPKTCYKSKNFMDKIVEFSKNIVLSKEEKLLRKYGLKNSCGDYTEAAKEIVINHLCDDNKDYLAEIAKAKEEEEKEK